MTLKLNKRKNTLYLSSYPWQKSSQSAHQPLQNGTSARRLKSHLLKISITKNLSKTNPFLQRHLNRFKSWEKFHRKKFIKNLTNKSYNDNRRFEKRMAGKLFNAKSCSDSLDTAKHDPFSWFTAFAFCFFFVVAFRHRYRSLVLQAFLSKA